LFPALGDAFAASALTALETVQAQLAVEEREAHAAAAAATATTADEGAAAAAAAAEEEEQQREGTDRPVLLHLFSNGGYLFAGNVMHAHYGRERPLDPPRALNPKP
jgi:hypothetical protein